jgi:TolB-like protein
LVIKSFSTNKQKRSPSIRGYFKTNHVLNESLRLVKVYEGEFMRKKLWFISIMLCLSGSVFAQNQTVLDKAINDSMIYLLGRLNSGAKVIVLSFSSPAPALSEYVTEEFTARLVNDGSLTVVDRPSPEFLRQEAAVPLAGEVSAGTAQSIGQKLGVQYVISGSLTPLGTFYRMRVQAISVESANIEGVAAYTISEDATLAALLGRQGASPAASVSESPPVPSAAPAAVPTPPLVAGPVVTKDSSTPGAGEFYVTGQAFLNAAVLSINEYFRRYQPSAAVISDTTVRGTAKYGRYNVEINVQLSGNRYAITVLSTVGQDQIKNWTDNIQQRIINHLK